MLSNEVKEFQRKVGVKSGVRLTVIVGALLVLLGSAISAMVYLSIASVFGF